MAEQKAGTILIALDGTRRRPEPCLMRVAGAKDTESWTTFFATLEGAPEVVVADLDAAIARAVRETWPHTTAGSGLETQGAAPRRRWHCGIETDPGLAGALTHRI